MWASACGGRGVRTVLLCTYVCAYYMSSPSLSPSASAAAMAASLLLGRRHVRGDAPHAMLKFNFKLKCAMREAKINALMHQHPFIANACINALL